MYSMRCSQCEHYIEANAGEGKIYGCDRSKCVFEPTTKNDLEVDLISRADVKRAITDVLQSDICDYDLREFLDDLVDIPSVTPQEPRWIPVSERLPEEPYGCLVTVETDDRFGEPQRVLYPEFVGYDGETWNLSEGIRIPFEVVAWQPLPMPYKESEEV